MMVAEDIQQNKRIKATNDVYHIIIFIYMYIYTMHLLVSFESAPRPLSPPPQLLVFHWNFPFHLFIQIFSGPRALIQLYV